MPRFPAIYDEDLYDSFEYLDLEYIQVIGSNYMGKYMIFESQAALTGYNLSVCPDIEDPASCWPDQPLNDTYYVVDYTKSSLHAYQLYTFSGGVYDVSELAEHRIDLGSDAQWDNPNEQYYWEEVRQTLLKPLLRRLGDIPARIVVVGESSGEQRFRECLHEVLESYFKGEEISPVLDGDPLYVQAKGVAELVRRSKYLPKPHKPDALGEQPLFDKAAYPTDQRQKILG